jgi:hypothetical protein
MIFIFGLKMKQTNYIFIFSWVMACSLFAGSSGDRVQPIKISENAKKKVIALVLEDRATRVRHHQWLAECQCPAQDKWVRPHEPGCYQNDKGGWDCGGLAHFMCTGRNGNIIKIAERHKNDTINVMEGIHERTSKHHEPYTVYELLAWGLNGWSETHYFTYLNDGRYISNTGGGPSRVFSSFAEEVRKDGFPSHGFPKKTDPKIRWAEFSEDPRDAYIADRIACGPDDIEFTSDEFARFKDSLNEEEVQYFQSKIHKHQK